LSFIFNATVIIVVAVVVKYNEATDYSSVKNILPLPWSLSL
jgi:hypothetical protein